tara:strand:+ start:141 stop:473 length:333 start_codon:yes stop_codon:yes gene_type:complete
MARYAKLGMNNKVTDVIEIDDIHARDANNNIDNETGRQWLENLTSYPNWVLCDEKSAAFKGSTYDEDQDCFIPVKPYASWTWDAAKKCWEAPTPRPDDADYWDEENQAWV